jgi:hypothetical protein
MGFTVVRNSYPNIVRDGLVLNVDAGASISYPGSGTTWSDISGRGNNGTLTNGPTYSSANSGSIVFDGTNDYVSGSIPTLNNWSMCLWYRSTDITSQVVFYPFSGTTGANGLGFGGTFDVSTNNRWYFFDGTNIFSSSNTAITTNVWYYLVVTKSSTTYNLYTNGSLSLSGSGVDLSLTQYNLGRRGDNLWYVNGQIAQASIYNRALSAAEVLQNYNALLPRFYSIVTSGLVLNLDAGNPNSYSPPRSDQYASSLVLAVPMNGANTGTTFTDQSDIIKGSGTAKTITVNNNAKTLTAQSKFYGSSGFFDGANDALTIPAGTDFAYGTGDFTVEAWVYQASSAGFQVLFAQTVSGTNYFVLASNSGVPSFYSTLSGGGDAGVTTASSLPVNTWNHVAVTRQSGTVRVFVNGIAGTSVTNTTNLTDTSYVPTIGAYTHAGFANGWNGYIQDFRIYKGLAKYTTNFKPPSISSGVTISSASGGVPILNTTDDYGTVNGSSGTTWTDISGNGNNGTLTNGPTYNGANYGSIVFDGTNDFVNIPDSSSLTSTSALTINCWVRATAFGGGYSSIVGKGTSDGDEEYCLLVYSSFLYFDVGSGGPYTGPSYTFNTNTWYNICCVHLRTAGTSSLLCYVNGVSLNNSTINSTDTINDNSLPVSIGSRFYNSSNGPFNGNIANTQIYNRALTAAEVSQNFNALKWRYGI